MLLNYHTTVFLSLGDGNSDGGDDDDDVGADVGDKDNADNYQPWNSYYILGSISGIFIHVIPAGHLLCFRY